MILEIKGNYIFEFYKFVERFFLYYSHCAIKIINLMYQIETLNFAMNLNRRVAVVDRHKMKETDLR